MGEAVLKHQPTLDEIIEALRAENHELEMELARRTADLIETQGELTWFTQRQEKRARELSTVYKAARLMLNTTDFDDLAAQVLKMAAEEINAGAGSLMLLEGDTLVVRAVYGGGRGHLGLVGTEQPKSEGVSGWVVRAGRPLLIANIADHPLFEERRTERYTGVSCLSAPLHVRGHVRGVINVTNKVDAEVFDDDDLQLLRTMATMASIGFENIELNEERKRSERMITIGELASKMAHEIRNPLQAIKMNIQILAKKLPLEGKIKAHHEILTGEVERIEKLVANLLAFARQEKLTLTPCNVNEIIEHVVHVMQPVLDAGKVDLTLQLADDIVPIDVDRDKITQALMNMVLNSKEAMEGGGTLSIATMLVTPAEDTGPHRAITPNDPLLELAHLERPPYIEIKVSDTGIGIPEEVQQKIFNPFFTTKVHGTGLGLSTTMKIIEQHHGQLHILSRPGLGTAIKIFLPVSGKLT